MQNFFYLLTYFQEVGRFRGSVSNINLPNIKLTSLTVGRYSSKHTHYQPNFVFNASFS